MQHIILYMNNWTMEVSAFLFIFTYFT